MKIEEQHLIRVDGGHVMSEWTDLETGAKRYEVSGHVDVNLQTPQGPARAPVQFGYGIEAENLQGACEQLVAGFQAEADKAVKAFIANLSANQRRIQVAREDQVLQIRKDRMGRNGSL
jgi:hypothetical protein